LETISEHKSEFKETQSMDKIEQKFNLGRLCHWDALKECFKVEMAYKNISESKRAAQEMQKRKVMLTR